MPRLLIFSAVQHGVAFDPKIEKSIKPLAAGVEVDDGSFEFSFTELGIPRAKPGTLKAGPENHIILTETMNVCRRQLGAAPVQIIQRAPGFSMPVLGFLFHIMLL